MSRQHIQTIGAVGVIVLGAILIGAISGLQSVRAVHPRFPVALQLFGVYLAVIAPLALMPTPLPSLGRLALWNALGIGIGALVAGVARSGALLAIPVVCIGIGLALWPPVPHPDKDRPLAIILTTGGLLAVLLPAAWTIFVL